MQVHRPPLGAPKLAFSASHAEGYEGVVDGMIQGTFRSVDNEIDQQDFESLIKTTAKDIVDDVIATKPPQFPEIREEQNGSEQDEFNQMRELLLLPTQKRSMSGKHFSLIAPRRYIDTLAKLKLQPAYQKQMKQK